MRRCLILLLLAAVAPLWAQGGPATTPAQRQQAFNLLTTAEDLIKAAHFTEAETKIQQARDLAPDYPDVYATLAHLYAVWADQSQATDACVQMRTKAVDACGQLLTLRPDHEWGRNEMKSLFYGGPLPRSVRALYLAYSGVAFTADEVRWGEARRRLAYTTSLLFHESMGRDGAPASIAVPVTGDKVFCQVNRSCYGFTMAPDSDLYQLNFALSWPSETLSGGRNYGPVAARLIHLLLRYSLYSRLTFDLPREMPLVSGYFCSEGPAGAETYQKALYFYNINTPRSAVEWARQAAHEYGHLVLPEIGRFTRPEPFANGELGERLFLQCLAEEAGEVAGDPWPSKGARQALAALWPGEDFDLTEYLGKTCRTSLNYWLLAGPESPLLNAPEPGQDAMQYIIGFLLWTEAAYGPDMLRGVLQGAAGAQPTDFVLAFKNLMAKQAQAGPLSVDAGSLNLPAAKLAQPPLEGAFGRRNVTLGPGNSAPFLVYLPAGSWLLSPQPAPAELTVTLDGKGPLVPDEKGNVQLGRLAQDGWHTVTLQLSDKGQPFVLERLLFKLQPQT